MEASHKLRTDVTLIIRVLNLHRLGSISIIQVWKETCSIRLMPVRHCAPNPHNAYRNTQDLVRILPEKENGERVASRQQPTRSESFNTFARVHAAKLAKLNKREDSAYSATLSRLSSEPGREARASREPILYEESVSFQTLLNTFTSSSASPFLKKKGIFNSG